MSAKRNAVLPGTALSQTSQSNPVASGTAGIPPMAATRRPARPVGVGKGLDADDPPIVDGQERGSGLIDFELVRPADDVHDDRYLITGVVEPQRLNPVALPSREELTPEAPHTVKAAVTVDGKQ